MTIPTESMDTWVITVVVSIVTGPDCSIVTKDFVSFFHKVYTTLNAFCGIVFLVFGVPIAEVRPVHFQETVDIVVVTWKAFCEKK